MRLLLLSFLITSLSFAQQSTFTFSPAVACVGSPVSYFGQSTPGFTVLSWNWNFGDGTSSTLQNPTHIYATPGSKTITLTIQYEGVSPSPFSQQVIQVNPKPNASFTATVSGCSLPATVNFNNNSSGAVSQVWTFGNGSTSTVANPAGQSYATAGTYNPRLIITNSFGCADTATQTIVINNFSAGITAPASICRGMATTFTDNSSASANAWIWSFPGATPPVSSLENPTVSYANPGTYTVTLTASNTSTGCSATTTHQVTVLPSPQPSFTVNPSAGCAPESVTFTNTSPAGTSFIWNFGDGATATGQNPPPHTYTTNGTFYPSLIMTDNNGCTGAFVFSSITLGIPTAGFQQTAPTGCAPHAVAFSDTAHTYGPIDSWLWDFGNGNTSTAQFPTETFDVGIYDVTLTITSGGCTATQTYPGLIVVGQPFDPVFTKVHHGNCANSELDLTSTTDLTPYTAADVTFAWTPCGSGETTTIEVDTDTGWVDITLIITHQGCVSTSPEDSVYINGPVGSFSIDGVFCNTTVPATVALIDESLAGKASEDVDMTWDWGDGSPVTFFDDDILDVGNGSTNHIYNNYGIYTIIQVIENHTTGCSDSNTVTFEIGEINTVISLSTNDSICVNTPFTMDATSSSTTLSGGISQYVFLNYDGFVLPDNPDGVASNSFDTPGIYQMHLQTYAGYQTGEYMNYCGSGGGLSTCQSDTVINIVVLDPPKADFIPNDSTGCAPFAVSFTNASVADGNGVPPNSLTYTFPDGSEVTSDTLTPVTYSFSPEGVFVVSMIATDPFGCESLPVTDRIYVTKPVASFSLSKNVICEPDALLGQLDSVLAVSTSPFVSSWTWMVDGNTVSSNDSLYAWFDELNNPATTHFDHTIQLIVADSNGCTDAVTQPIVVSTPLASLTYLLDGASTNSNGDYTCPPVFAEFTNESQSYGDITDFSWTFGDGNTSIEEDPDNTYVFSGTYDATLIIVDEYGCVADTLLDDFLTIGGPQAHPLWTQDPTGCARVVHFDLGPGSVGVAGVTWNLDDGNTVMDSLTFDHLYAENQTYYSSATIVDADGCQVVYPLPPITIPDVGLDAFFSYSPAEIDLGEPVYFTDQSTSVAGIEYWTWDLVTIPVFTNVNDDVVSNQYFIAGSYPVSLIIQDINGCIDTFTLQVPIQPEFTMPNVFTSNGDGVNDVFALPYEIFKDFDILIVNRWGNTIHDALGVTGTVFWDGHTDSGDLCSDGVYFYLIKGRLKDGTYLEKHGFLELFTGR